MAAGLGSRFGGGIKQLEPVGLNDEIIMDYSIHDAIEAGFNKIIFVIRKDIESDFRERIGNRVEAVCNKAGVEVAYVFQTLDAIPKDCSIPTGRMKPWGTGQAVLSAKNLIQEPFVIINADDYYGKEGFCRLNEWLVEEREDTEIAMAGFILKNTLSDNGGVSRGVCKVDEKSGYLIDIIETGNIMKTEDGVEADGVKLDSDSHVSMNMWGFASKDGSCPIFMNILDEEFKNFFATQVQENPLKAEYQIPTVIGSLLKEGKVSVKVLETKDKWFGVTYQEDKQMVKDNFKKLIDEGVYQVELYSDLISKK